MEHRSNGCHVGGYELSWLQLTDPSFGSAGGASPEVQAHMGDHVRSALNYTFCFDARERSDTGLLHSGHALRLHGSVAGLSPDESQLQHIRATADMQHVLPLSEGGALVIDTSCGAFSYLTCVLACVLHSFSSLYVEHFGHARDAWSSRPSCSHMKICHLLVGLSSPVGSGGCISVH